MKLVATVFIYLLSILPKTSDSDKSDLIGLWKGHYGTINEIYEITVQIEPDNKAQIICTYNDACITTFGSYKLLGDSAIIISSLLPESKTPEVLLYGILNRTGSFMDGDWDGSGNMKGCFYLRKQPSQTDLY